MKTTINYRLPSKYILLFSPEKTQTGIILTPGSRPTEDYTVALTGPECTNTKVKDRVVIDGGVTLWNIDGVDYWQIHESQIIGYVLNDGVIKKGEIPSYNQDPTAHYNK